MRTSLQEALIIAVVLLNAYSFGADCVERFVNYQTWRLIPAEAFRAYHQAQQPLIRAFVVAPLAIGFALQVWLAVAVPVGVSRWVVWTMVIASVAGVISTLTLQLPIHAHFDRNGMDAALLERLLRTDWIRKAADAVRLGATAVLLHQLLSAR